MTDTKTNALNQANAQMDSIRAMVAALECDFDRLEELRERKEAGAFVAGWNMAGYMPDNEPYECETFEEAKDVVIDEINGWADMKAEAGEEDAVKQLESAIEFVRKQKAGFSFNVGGIVFFVTEGQPLDSEELEELEELEEAADGCESQDDARDRIEWDALSVEVRNGWHAPGCCSDPTEFQILLCTGGPAVRIRGELDQHGEPCRAWMEYQDWFTPWTERVNREGDEEALLTYARCFYFGE